MIATPLPPPPAIEYRMDNPHCNDKMWNGFDLTYDGFLNLLNRLEKSAEFETLDQNQANQLRNIMIHLARFGATAESAEENDLLTRDIVQLFEEDEEDDSFDYAYSVNGEWVIPTLAAYNTYQVIPCKSLKKKLKRTARKVGKFVRKHKKEIIIGAVAAVAIGVTAYLVVGYCANAAVAAAAASAAAAPPDNSHKHAPQIHDELPPEIPADEGIEENFTFFPIAQVDLGQENAIKEAAREVCALIVHEVWDGIGEAGNLVHELEKEISNVPTLLGIEDKLLPSVKEPHEDWRDVVAAGHDKIDEWFYTEQAPLYTDEHKKVMNEKFVISELPPPILGHLETTGEVAKIATAIRTGEETIAIAEEAALAGRSIAQTEEALGIEVRAAPPAERGIAEISHVQGKNIWQLDGKNIKKVDWDKMLNDERIKHIFKNSDHNLDKPKLTPQDAYKKITEALVETDNAGKIPANKPFKVRVQVDKHEIEVRGIVIDGELRYSTFFIPNN